LLKEFQVLKKKVIKQKGFSTMKWPIMTNFQMNFNVQFGGRERVRKEGEVHLRAAQRHH